MLTDVLSQIDMIFCNNPSDCAFFNLLLVLVEVWCQVQEAYKSHFALKTTIFEAVHGCQARKNQVNWVRDGTTWQYDLLGLATKGSSQNLDGKRSICLILLDLFCDL